MARLALCALVVLAVAGCGEKSGGGSTSAAPSPATGAPPWPAPPNPMQLTRKAGLIPERAEFLEYHVHAHLDVFVNGDPVRVPAGIGINIHDPGVHSAKLQDGTTGYGSIDLCRRICISPLHTHDASGILHTETKTVQPNRLGQFFTEWAVRLTSDCVGGFCKPEAPIAIFVDGERYTSDPREIELSNGKEIAIVIGTPPSSIPESF